MIEFIPPVIFGLYIACTALGVFAFLIALYIAAFT